MAPVTNPLPILAVSLAALLVTGCGRKSAEPVVAEAPVAAATETEAEGRKHLPPGIDWFAGDVEAAFAAAKAANKPIFLYWGAEWCPPCAQIKSTIFNKREFQERSRLFVSVYLDGDTPSAQRHGERFGVVGYPTMILFRPDGTEITRLPGGVDVARYAKILDVALADARPVTEILAAAASGGDVTSNDWRLLAYYSWGSDNGRILPEAERAATFLRLSDRCPPELQPECARLYFEYLGAVASGEGKPISGLDRAAARNQLLGLAAQSQVLTQVRPDGLEDAPQLQVDIDRDKAAALGVGFDSINATLSVALGSAYVNDFPSSGRLQRVVVQADAPARMQPEDVLRLHATNNKGQQVPLSAFAGTRWVTGAMQTVRYNGYPAMRIGGSAAPGYSTGDAMAEMERLAAQLPAGFGYEWTGLSREEKIAGNQALILYGFAILAVFLCLAALYESWAIPLAVILVVPLGVFGVVLATLFRGYANDVYFQVGLVTIIGLSAKNAILIIEFAKDLQAQGKSAMEAALEAAHLRFRPIVMTSLAFILGVTPLFLASGAGSASQRAIGTGVVGGMISAVTLSVLFVPVFFVVKNGPKILRFSSLSSLMRFTTRLYLLFIPSKSNPQAEIITPGASIP